MKNSVHSPSSGSTPPSGLGLILAVLVFLIALTASGWAAPLSGTYTIPGSYPTIAAAIADLNAQGVSGPVVFNVAAGHTETAVNLVLSTTTPTATYTVTFQKSGAGANPLITSGVGTGTYDGIIEFQGTDYVTFDGIDLVEDTVANTTSTTRMEWGYGIFMASATDASQYITIKNCTVTLKWANSSIQGGVYMKNSNASVSTAITPTAASGKLSGCSIFNNTFVNCYNGVYLYSSLTSGYYGEDNWVGVGGGNTIRNHGGTSTTAYGVYVIYQNNPRIENNTIDNTMNNSHTGILYGVYVSGSVTGIVNLMKNVVSLKSVTTSSTTYGIKNDGGSTGLYMSDNKVYNCTIPYTFYGIYSTATGFPATVCRDTLTANTFTGTSTAYLLYTGSPGATIALKTDSNMVYSNVRTGASGSMYCMYVGTGINQCSYNQIHSNSVTSSGSSASTIYGIWNALSSTTENYYNNIVRDLSIGGTSSSTSHLIYAMYRNTVATSTRQDYNNQIYNLSISTGSGTIYGYYSSSANVNSIFKNRLYNFSVAGTGGIVYGIYILGGTTNHVYNNFISDLKAPAATGTMAVNGIYFSSGTTNNAFYNTVYLNATTTSATTFGTSALYTSTTPTTTLRNNILVNVSSKGSANNANSYHAAYRRSSGSLATYGSASNNNCLYTGTSDTTKVLYYDTYSSNTARTIDAFKNLVTPRDGASVSELPPFVNVASAPYDLHLNTSSPTQCESGGTQITSPAITDDYDGHTRYGEPGYSGSGTGTDIGADEGNFTPNDLAGPSIAYTPMMKIPSTGTQTLSATISDASNVESNPGFSPRLYYKRTTDANTWVDNSSGTNGWKYVETPDVSSPFTFAMDFSLLNGGTGIATGDTIQYFVVAQDMAPTPNISVNSGVLSAIPMSVDLQASEFPVSGPINSFAVVPTMTGTYTVGTGGTYTTLKAFFDDLNTKVLIGNITGDVIGDCSETATAQLEVLNEYPSGSNFTVTVTPSGGAMRTISGNPAAAALIKLNGADRVIIDGLNTGGNGLTLFHTGTAGTIAVVQLSSLGTGLGATYNQIKNCTIKSGTKFTSSTGIAVGGATILSTGNDNDNLTIQGNVFKGLYYGTYFLAATTGMVDGLSITNNTFGGSDTTAAEGLQYKGIHLSGATSPTISQNVMKNIATAATLNTAGVDLVADVTDAVVSKNKIYNMWSLTTSGYACYGINVGAATVTGALISNNMISHLITDGDGTSTTYNPTGIRLAGGTNHKVYFNSVYLDGSFMNMTTADYSFALLLTASTVTGSDIRNNVFANIITGGSGSKSFAVYAPTGTTFATINHNDYYVAGANGVLGYLGADITTIAGWRTATGQDLNSLSAAPSFTSNTDLHINSGAAQSWFESTGTTIAGYSTDIDGDTRPGPTGSVNGGAIAPDLGADEFDGSTISPMVYTSSTTTQVTGYAIPNQTNQAIIGIQVVTTNAGNPLAITQFDLSTNGSTNPATDITNAKLWYTGTSSTFATTAQYGTTATAPSGSFSITGSQILEAGTNYFWLTYDVPTGGVTGNTLDAECSSITIAATPQTPTVTAPTGSRTIAGPLAGTYTVGTGGQIPDIKTAFDLINAVGLAGNTTLSITTDQTLAASAVLNQWTETPPASNFTLTIQPSGARTVSGSIDGFVIKLNGADRTTINGLNTGGNSLAIVNTNTLATNSGGIWLASNGAAGTGADNNTIQNLTINAGANNQTNRMGLYVADQTISSAGTGFDNDNLTITGNTFLNGRWGIYVGGDTVATTDNLVISNNTVGSNTVSEYISYRGIEFYRINGGTISNNTIFNIKSDNLALQLGGIWLGARCGNNTIVRNRIFGLNNANTGGYGAFGINIGSTVKWGTTNNLLANNLVYDVITYGDPASTTYNAFGIRLDYGYDNKVYFNSVNMTGAYQGSTPISAAYVQTNVVTTGSDVRNNAFVNSITGPAGIKSYAIYVPASTSFGTINYNNYYASGAYAVFGYFGADVANLAAWQTATTQDANSMSANPEFNSAENLVPTPLSTMANAGTPIVAVPTDYLGTTRNATTPTIGAYETLTDASGPSITYTAVTNTTSTANRTLTGFATITDYSSVNVTTGTAPRIYYKKKTDANAFAGNTSTDNGWKWAEATNASSPFDFTINYGILNGGSAVSGDTIQYFVVAQDLAGSPQVSANPSGGFVGTSVSAITTAPTAPNSYAILPTLAGGTYKIGGTGTTPSPGCSYVDITAAFADLNTKIITGPVVFELTSTYSSTEENGFPLILSENAGSSSTNTITLKPESGVSPTITGSSTTSILKLNGADWFILDGSNSGGTTKDLTITNTSTSGTTAVIHVASLGTGAGALNNVIRNATIIGGEKTNSTSYGLYSGSGTIGTAGASNNYLTVENNTFNKTYFGVYIAGVSGGVHDNVLIKKNEMGSSTSTSSLGLKGVYVTYATNLEVTENHIFNLVHSTYDETGVQLATGVKTNVRITRNRIHDLLYTSTSGYQTRGIQVNTGDAASDITIANNVIYAVNADGYTAMTNGAACGIYLDGSTGGINVWHNTINLYGYQSKSGTNYITAAMYVGASCTALDIRNNILANSITQNGSFTSYAVYSAAANTAYTTINNNCYYTPGANGKIGYLTSARTSLADWQTATAQDANSVAVDPPFNADNNLVLQPSSTLLAQGATLAGVTVDYLGTSRGTPPTIGAYETPADAVGPTITFSPIPSTSTTTNRTLTGFATITDYSGVNITSGTKPRLYYKKKSSANVFAGNTSTDNGWKWTEATNGSSPFDFVVDYSIILGGSVATGDTIQYFVVAQDLAAVPQVAANPSTGFVGTSVSAITSAPTTPEYYRILPALAGGTYKIGGTGSTPSPGCTYVDITAAFDDLNLKMISGPVVLELTSTYSAAEENAFPLTLNANGGSSATNTITLKPETGVSPTITGSSSTSILKLNGVDYFVLDGSNSGGTTKNLTISNSNTSTTSCVVWLSSPSASDGATNNVIKNTIVRGNTPTSTLAAIFSGGTSISATGYALTTNSNNTYQNNTVHTATYGYLLIGMSTTTPDVNTLVTGNAIGTGVTGETFDDGGIYVLRQDGITITGNTIQGVISSSSNDLYGIRLLDSKNAIVSRNKVFNCSYTSTSTYDIFGISSSSSYSTVGNPSQNTFVNNLIYDITSTGTSSSTWHMSGINVNAGYGDKFYYNTVYLAGTLSGSTATSGTAVAAFSNGNITTTTTCTNVDVRNNIFSVTGNVPGTLKVYAHYTTLASYTGATIDRNLLYVAPTGTGSAYIGYFNSADQSSFAAWKTATSVDANSLNANPLLNAPTKYTPQIGISPVIDAGTPIAGITTDYDGTTRSGTTPNIGAYETEEDIAGPVISYAALLGTSSTANRTLTGFATITDGTGVNVTSGTKPRIYYKKKTDANAFAGNTSTDNGWKWTEASNATSPFDFTIDYSIINGGTVAGGDTIQYFITAQDTQSPVNVSAQPSAGFVGTSVAAITSAPTTPNAYPILSTLAGGTYKIGGTGTTPSPGCAYVDLTAAYAQLNSREIQGPIVLELTATYSAAEEDAFPLTLNAVAGASATNTITLRPEASVTPTISGSSTTAVLKFNGTDYFTIEGSNTGGSSRDLTITNTNTASSTAVIQFASLGAGAGATYNTVKNCVLANGDTVNASNYVISIGGATIASTGADNTNYTITNNTFAKAFYGLYVGGLSSNKANTFTITNNVFGSDVEASFLKRQGMYLTQATNVTISGNTIKNIRSASGADIYSVYLAAGCSNVTVAKNVMYGSRYLAASGYGAVGVNVATNAAGSNVTIANNLIYDQAGDGYTSAQDYIAGIAIMAGGSGGVKIYHNSVNLFGGVTRSAATADVSAAMFIASGATDLDIRNNIFSNSIVNTVGVASAYAIYSAAANTAFTQINGNVYYASGTQGVLGFLTSNRADIAAWRTASGQDQFSIGNDPRFTSNTNLTILAGSGSDPVSGASNTGVPLAAVTDDYAGSPRNAQYPDAGAYEFANQDRTLSTPGALSTGYDNLTISGGTYTLTGQTNIAGTLSLAGGALLDLGSNNLVLGPTATVTGTFDATNMIIASGTGTVSKLFTGAGSFTFPVGDNTGTTEYSPATLTFNSGTFTYPAYASLRLTDAKHPSLLTPGANDPYITRYWTLTSSGITAFNADASFTYVDADITGTEADLFTAKYDTYWMKGAAVNAATNTLSMTGMTSFSAFTGAGEKNADARLVVNTKVFLQGAYNGVNMDNWMNNTDSTMVLLPLDQPYSDPLLWNYAGTENVPGLDWFSTHPTIADWVLVELRSGDPLVAMTTEETRAAFVKTDGTIVDLDGVSPVLFTKNPGNYYIVVRHRNHIPIMSAAAQALSLSSPLYSFTTGQAQAFSWNTPADAMKDLGSGVYGLFGGDGTGDSFIDSNDLTDADNNQFMGGYLLYDVNLDGFVDANDMTTPDNNQFIGSQLP